MSFNDDHAHCRDGLISFDPERHVYTFEDEEFESVTTVVDSCFEKFDAEYWAAIKRPNDPDSLIKEWEAKGKAARELGTLMHDRIERFYLNEAIEPEAENDQTFRHFRRFAAERPLTPYRTEWRIFSERFRIAGTLDFLAVDQNGRYTIYDWKRSTKVVDRFGHVIDKCYGKTATHPLRSLPDTTFNHYALQVSIYRFILSLHYGIEVDDAFLGVFHPDMPRHYCVALPYLRDEVVTLLNHRLK